MARSRRRNGKLIFVLGERGVAGADARHFDRPTDVAVLPDGSFYVSDGCRNTRVMKFGPDGKFELQWGSPGSGPGQFNVPHGLAIDSAGRVYVADRENDRVQVFDPSGHFIAQWKATAIGRPYGIALLRGHLMAIADGGEHPDSGSDRSGVSVVDLTGRVIARAGRRVGTCFGSGCEGEGGGPDPACNQGQARPPDPAGHSIAATDLDRRSDAGREAGCVDSRGTSGAAAGPYQPGSVDRGHCGRPWPVSDAAG